MIRLKSEEEIALMKHGGTILHDTMQEVMKLVVPGVTTNQIDSAARKIIKEKGGEGSFDKVPNYHWVTCLPVNEQIVHTPPSDRVLKDGDVLTIDMGVFYKGFHTDHAITMQVGKTDEETQAFLKTGEEALRRGLSKVKNGAYIGEISQAIEEYISGHGLFIIKQLTGHGIGRELHEEPYVPNFLDRPVKDTYKIRPGLVIAVEVMYSKGTEEMAYEKGSDWSIVTRDKSLSAQFEHTVAVGQKEVLTLT